MSDAMKTPDNYHSIEAKHIWSNRWGEMVDVVLAGDYAELKADNQHLQDAVGQLRHDRECLIENLRDVRDAVWRTSMNATLGRFHEEELSALEDKS